MTRKYYGVARNYKFELCSTLVPNRVAIPHYPAPFLLSLFFSLNTKVCVPSVPLELLVTFRISCLGVIVYYLVTTILICLSPI